MLPLPPPDRNVLLPERERERERRREHLLRCTFCGAPIIGEAVEANVGHVRYILHPACAGEIRRLIARASEEKRRRRRLPPWEL